MSVDEIVNKFEDKHYLVKMGTGKLSRWFNVQRGDIYEAKRVYYERKKEKELNLSLKNTPKILILDIETAPIRAFVWRLWKQNVYLPQIISTWFMLTWSAKWLFDTEMKSARLTSQEAINQDDKRIVTELWSLLDEADVIIAHNGDQFDIPKIKSRCIINGLNPPSTYQQIDTKKIAAKQFGFESNKLDGLAMLFGFKVKLDTDFELWTRCYAGEEEALKYMEEYNHHDVELLEEVYLKLRPWTKSHPNLALYIEADYPVCSSCGSHHLERMDSYYYTPAGKYPQYRCECGAVSRGRKTEYPKNKRDHLLLSVSH
jgi:hypothetical protein